MKFSYVNSTKIAALLIGGTFLLTTGCSVTRKPAPVTPTPVATHFEEATPIPSSEVVRTTVSPDWETMNSEQKEQAVVDQINVWGGTIRDYVSKENIQDLGEKAWSGLCHMIDFIFFDETINGVTFEELSDSAKEKVVSAFQKGYDAMEQKYPDFTEKVTDKTQDIASFIKENGSKAYHKAYDFLDEKINVGDLIDQVKDGLGTVKDKIKEFYIDHHA